MRLSNVLDFYILDLLDFYVHEAKHPPYNRAVVRLQEDVHSAAEDVRKQLALSLRDYLLCACFGEARHAGQRSDQWYSEIPYTDARSEACTKALNYEPRQALLDLEDLFTDSCWQGSYGGTAWGGIAEWAQQYGIVSDGTFIDHVIDLEHNNGSVLDKADAGEIANMQLDVPSSHLRSFLNIKATSKDLLIDLMCFETLLTYVSKKTARLVCRYFRVCLESEPPISWLFVPDGEWLDTQHPSFGYDCLGFLDNSPQLFNCIRCDKILEEDVVYWNSDGDPYCEDCYDAKYDTCHNCGREVRNSEACSVNVDGCTETLCEDCLEGETDACSECFENFYLKDLVTVDGQHICKSCEESETVICTICGEQHLDRNTVCTEVGVMCYDCHKAYAKKEAKDGPYYRREGEHEVYPVVYGQGDEAIRGWGPLCQACLPGIYVESPGLAAT